MPPLDFPASPITGATYAGPGGVIWAWDGSKWVNGTQIGTAYAPIKDPVFTGNPTAPNPPSGDADTSVATTAFVSAAVAPAFNGVGRNLCHNPLFNVAQRGVGPFATTAAYTLDRWQMALSLDTVSVFPYAANDTDRAQIGDETVRQFLGNSFTGNAGAAAFNIIFQRIEGVRRLSGKTIIVSFYAQGSAAQKLGVSLDQFFGTGGSPSATALGNGQSVQLAAASVWQRFSLIFTLPSATGKTLGTNGDDNTVLSFWYSSGTTQATRAGNIGVQSGAINIWGVQLEVGSVATPLEKPDPRYDLANCQRFYEVCATSWVGTLVAGNYYGTSVSFAVEKRVAPTITSLNQTGAVNGGMNLRAPSQIAPATRACMWMATANATTPSGGYVDNFSASADL